MSDTVTVRLTGEAARYVRDLQSKVGGTFKSIVQRIVETEAGVRPRTKFEPPVAPYPRDVGFAEHADRRARDIGGSMSD